MTTKSLPRESNHHRTATAAGAVPTNPPKLMPAEDQENPANRDEPLRKKHMKYVIKRPHKPTMLVHPYLPVMPINLDRCAHINQDIANLEAEAAELLQKGDVYEFVLCHTPPFRVAAFRRALRTLGTRIKDEDYWETLRMVYGTIEYPSGHSHTMRRLFASRRKKRELFMFPEERDLFHRLPETLTVYRGYSRYDGAGMSWTLDRRVADWFAHRRPDWGQPRVITGVVRREDVLALLASGGEAEVLVPDGLVSQQVHGPAVASKMPFSVSDYANPPVDIEAICVREAPRPTSRHRPARTDRKPPARVRVQPR